MTQPMRTQAIKAFLENLTHVDLAGLYNYSMEVQVNVGQDGGEPVGGEYQGKRWRGWKNNSTGELWKPFRIPWNANTEAHYTDSALNFDLVRHAEGIGMTGWNWEHKLSLWVAYDFDALTGHSEKHARKLTDDELTQVREAVAGIPWVTLRRSTSGKGLHLYVFLEPVRTANHNEHAALARAILGQLSGICGVDFKTKVDICGGNMWVWHRKMRGTDGLKLLKQGERLTTIPPHWRDHLKVVRGERKRVVPFFVGEMKKPDAEDIFEQLSGQRVLIPLDDEHNKLLEFVRNQSNDSWWDSDHHMLITHTSVLKEAHEALALRGKFDTVATGKDRGHDHNCFCFPLRRGAWAVRRYSPGVAEASTWEQDGAGWTRCFFNKEPDLASACRAHGGKEHPAGGYVFDKADQAAQAAAMLGANLDLPNYMVNRKTRLKEHKDGRLVAELVHSNDDVKDQKLDSWIAEKGSWKKVFPIRVSSPMESESVNLDDTVRHLTTEDGKDMGWVVCANGEWQEEPLHHVKPALSTFGMKPNEVNAIVGSSVFRAWKLVNRPFQPEYPGDRQWNRGAPQLRFKPTDEESLTYPTWQKILSHCGSGLDSTIKDNMWCKTNGITCGADYLMCWIASMIKEPMEPLPYLFFWSQNQNTGKSSFHEALSLLLTNGYMRAEAALTNSGQFNGELLNAVLCVVEEIDLKKNISAYNKIKDWVTARQMSIHIKGKTPFLVPNTTHWIQAANSYLACPIFSGDSRITMIEVPDLDLADMIPKKALIPKLEKEAPHFISALKALELPVSPDRLNVPVIATAQKLLTEQANQSMLEIFIREKVFYIPGASVLYSDFYDAFREWLDPSHHQYWGKIRVGRELPPSFPKGKMHGSSQLHLGNLSWKPKEPDEAVRKKLMLKGDYLEPEKG